MNNVKCVSKNNTICLYHGTEKRLLKSILENGIEQGIGVEGHDGVHLSKNFEAAMYWAKWGWNKGKKDYKEEAARKSGYIPIVIRVCLPLSNARFITPDYNQAGDSVIVNEESGEEIDVYDPENMYSWDHEDVIDVIWNDQKRGIIPRDFIEIMDGSHQTTVTPQRKISRQRNVK